MQSDLDPVESLIDEIEALSCEGSLSLKDLGYSSKDSCFSVLYPKTPRVPVPTIYIDPMALLDVGQPYDVELYYYRPYTRAGQLKCVRLEARLNGYAGVRRRTVEDSMLFFFGRVWSDDDGVLSRILQLQLTVGELKLNEKDRWRFILLPNIPKLPSIDEQRTDEELQKLHYQEVWIPVSVPLNP
jgi:hypothetical protein